MTLENKGHFYASIKDAADNVLQVLSQQINVNTFCVASNDRNTSLIFSVFHQEEHLFDAGTTLSFFDAYWNIIVNAGREPVVINDVSIHEHASKLEITHNLNIKSFLGVPILLKNGEIYGTLCAIATMPHQFKEREVSLFVSMATFLSYFIELEHTEDLYRQLVENSPDGIIVEKEGRLIYANPATADLYGIVNQQELVGEKVEDLILPTDTNMIKANLDKIGQEMFAGSEQKLIQANGNYIDIETLESPLSFKGEPATQIMMRDITYRKQLNQLIASSEKLSVAGQLAAGVAHEIRNPITGIKGFIQLLQSSNEINHQYYDIILSEINRINEIVNEFLYLAKPEKPVMAFHDCTALLNEVVMLLNTEAIVKNITIDTRFDSSIPLVYCEGNQIKQVLINIIKNAVDVLPMGGAISIDVAFTENNIEITIQDNGAGIPKDRLIHLGEPFYTTKEKGTGLGLMVTRKIIEQHQGLITFESEMNVGTTVKVLLPINREMQI